jgi:putative ABC transport system permease protein
MGSSGTSLPQIALGEMLRFAYESFRANKVRFALTAVGMVIGTASLILVVTIGLSGKQYVLNQIQAIGANMIYAYYEGGDTLYGKQTLNDYITVDDVKAVQTQVVGIRAATPMVEFHEVMEVGGGKEKSIKILGVYPSYVQVRNLQVLAGRFFDGQDEQARNKVAVINEKLARTLYVNQENAVGQKIKIRNLPFVIVGTFKERVETFGQSEVTDQTVVIPYSTSTYLTGSNIVKQVFFSTADAADVPAATEQIKQVLRARHRPGSVYQVDNLTQLLGLAAKSANALTLVLLLVATVTLVVSGVGIMNIMLATVSARIREIGIRKAVGATNREIRLQFLAEAVSISLAGGMLGTIIGLLLPLSVRWFTNYRIPISGLSVIVAVLASSLVGIIFGTVPATRAAMLDPVESLRYE